MSIPCVILDKSFHLSRYHNHNHEMRELSLLTFKILSSLKNSDCLCLETPRPRPCTFSVGATVSGPAVAVLLKVGVLSPSCSEKIIKHPCPHFSVIVLLSVSLFRSINICFIHFGVLMLGALEKEMATPSSILAWKIPWTEEPGRLQSMESRNSQTQLNN